MGVFSEPALLDEQKTRPSSKSSRRDAEGDATELMQKKVSHHLSAQRQNLPSDPADGVHLREESRPTKSPLTLPGGVQESDETPSLPSPATVNQRESMLRNQPSDLADGAHLREEYCQTKSPLSLPGGVQGSDEDLYLSPPSCVTQPVSMLL